MKKIEKLDFRDLSELEPPKVPGLLAILDRLIFKIDELVDRVNVLDEPPGSPGKVAPRFPRPRYLPHDKEE